MNDGGRPLKYQLFFFISCDEVLLIAQCTYLKELYYSSSLKMFRYS